jgi:hypothetical protein
VLLLAAAVLVAVTTSPKVPASARCPQAPFTAPQVTGPSPAGLTCPALEVSGRADRANPELDPSFDVSIAPSRFPSSAPAAPEGLLQGFDSQGRLLFVQQMSAGGEFHTFVPVSEATARALARIRLTFGSAVAERSALPHGEPSAETVSVDDSHVVLAWSANLFPAVRVREYANGPLVAVGSGSTSYTEITIATNSALLFVDFSDGVHSYARSIRVWGR